ncbi:thiamine pyrophosphate-binding protein [Cyanobium sp. ATX 6A2]|uniref:thiamine pyrophosphate-binding protein n=1 Tax=Cyanobium sp. ATX 6A2 TaxID=2823700 RepID=UPI0020CB9596|nr:thiamine pyrophosphate-binding protein [Cyanobium sp. ATX 6A2]
MTAIPEPPTAPVDPEGSPRWDRAGRLGLLRQRGQCQPALVSGSELVASTLAALEFTWIAGVGGTPVHGIYSACAARGLRVLGTRTQAGATLMTAAAAFVAGTQCGAVVLSPGPAVTNAITGILVARDNGWPLLVLGGRRAAHGGQRGHFQQLDAASLIQPIAKWTGCAHAPADIPRLLHEAVRTARCGRPGPVYLDLPEDVLGARIVDPGPVEPLVWDSPSLEDRLVDGLARRLRAARNPVLILGDGVRWRLDLAQVRGWLERLSLPVVSFPLVRGVLAESHPFAVHGAESRAGVLAQADLVVLFGADLDWRLRFGAEIDPGAAVILVSDVTELPPTLAERGERWAADPGLLLNRLAQRSPAPEAPQRAMLRACEPVGDARPASESSASEAARLTIREVFEIIRAVIPPEAFLVVDGKITLEAAHRFLDREHPFLFLDPGWNGCMGTGVPFAMAARLHHPTRPLLLVTGDFAFGMGAIELETAVRHRLPFVVLVVNNDGAVGSLNQITKLPPDHPERVHAFQSALAYDQVATGLGFPACQASTAEHLHQALSTGLGSGKPLLVNTLVDPSSTAADGA